MAAFKELADLYWMTLIWVPRHEGNAGNERGDELSRWRQKFHSRGRGRGGGGRKLSQGGLGRTDGRTIPKPSRSDAEYGEDKGTSWLDENVTK